MDEQQIIHKKGMQLSSKCIIVSVTLYILLCIVSLFIINFDSNIWEQERGYYGNYHIKYETIRFNISVAKYYFGSLPIIASLPSLIFLLFRFLGNKVDTTKSLQPQNAAYNNNAHAHTYII